MPPNMIQEKISVVWSKQTLLGRVALPCTGCKVSVDQVVAVWRQPIALRRVDSLVTRAADVPRQVIKSEQCHIVLVYSQRRLPAKWFCRQNRPAWPGADFLPPEINQ